MLNLQSIATAKLSEVKKFARAHGILPQGDLRSKQVWIDAVSAFLSQTAETIGSVKAEAVELAKETAQGAVECISESIVIATSPQAIGLYKSWAIVAFRFTCRAFVLACLAIVVLGLLCADAYVALRQWLESDTVAELRLLTPEKIAHRVKSKSILWGTRLLGWARLQRDRARFQVDSARAAMVWHALTLKSRAHTARAALLH